MHNTTRNQFYPTTSLNLHVLSCKRYSCKKPSVQILNVYGYV